MVAPLRVGAPQGAGCLLRANAQFLASYAAACKGHMSGCVLRSLERSENMRTHNEIRILRRPEVEARTGLKRSSLYQMMADGEFPPSVKLGKRAVGWTDSSISAWLESRQSRPAA